VNKSHISYKLVNARNAIARLGLFVDSSAEAAAEAATTSCRPAAATQQERISAFGSVPEPHFESKTPLFGPDPTSIRLNLPSLIKDVVYCIRA